MIDVEIHHRGGVWFQVLHICLANFIFGYTLGVFNPCIKNVAYSLSWSSSERSLYSTLFSTSIPVGALFGSLAISSLCDILGRRKAFLLADLAIVLGSGLSAYPSTVSFGLGRLIVGLGAGMCLAGCTMYVGEVTPSQMKSSVGPVLGTMIAFGLTTSYAFGLILPTDHFSGSFNHFWQFMMGFPAMIAIYQAIIIGGCFKYDSPTYYLRTGDMIGYKAVLKLLFDEERIEEEIAKLENNTAGKAGSGKISDKAGTIEILCGKKYRRMVRVGSVLAFVQQLGGTNSMIFYSSVIFEGIGLSLFQSRFITFFIGVSTIIASFCTVPILKYIGRKPSLLSGHILLAIDLLIIGLLSQFSPKASALISTCVCIYFFIFAYSLQATMFAYLGEIQNATALSFSTALNFLSNIIVVLVFPSAADAFGIYSAFYFFSICMVLGAIYVKIDVFETKNKTIEMVSKELFQGML